MKWKVLREYFNGRAQLVSCDVFVDHRGSLVALDHDRLPFVPCRTFAVAGVPAGTVRGEHAHKRGKQMLVCLQGEIHILMRCQGEVASLVLSSADQGVIFGPGVWCRQKYAETGSVLLVLASDPYDPDSQIRAWT